MKTARVVPYALLGHPVGHSLSPAMHNAAFKARRLSARYSLRDVRPEELPRVLRELQTQRYGGLNITIPHKEAAYQFLAAHGRLTPTARLLRTVNTIVFPRHGVLRGDNTDAPGFLDALRESFRATPRNQTILLLGCGGAGRALALICAWRGAAAIYLADTQLAARRRLRQAIRRAAPTVPVACVSLKRARRRAVDCTLIIQATPVGMHPGDPSLLPPESFHPGQMVFDLIYNPAVTPLLATAHAAGARTANGLGMLLHQGARAFQQWTGRRPPVAVMRRALLNALKARGP